MCRKGVRPDAASTQNPGRAPGNPVSRPPVMRQWRSSSRSDWRGSGTDPIVARMFLRLFSRLRARLGAGRPDRRPWRGCLAPAGPIRRRGRWWSSSIPARAAAPARRPMRCWAGWPSGQDVLALSLPVTYWDMLGWKDTLASKANTDRQKAYAAGHGPWRHLHAPDDRRRRRPMSSAAATRRSQKAIAAREARYDRMCR